MTSNSKVCRLVRGKVFLWARRVAVVAVVLIGFSVYSDGDDGVMRGVASYYAKSWTGRMTSNGELLHHDSLTCAHRTLPFGTLLKVTNPANSLSVVVRVNDRGPFRRGRIIDLSWGAAKAIGMLAQGIATVIVERVNYVVIPFKDTTPEPLPELYLEAHEPPSLLRPMWQEGTEIKRDVTEQRIAALKVE